MPVVIWWRSCARTARSSAASTLPSARRPQPESSIRRPHTSRRSRSPESPSSVFKRATGERSSSSAAAYPSLWTKPSSVRSEQVPARLNKTLQLRRPLSLHSITWLRRPTTNCDASEAELLLFGGHDADQKRITERAARLWRRAARQHVSQHSRRGGSRHRGGGLEPGHALFRHSAALWRRFVRNTSREGPGRTQA